MSFKSDKFNTKRSTVNTLSKSVKQDITFNKLIKRLKEDIKLDSKLDLAAEFNSYNVNCDNCLKNRSKVVNMYLLSNKELNLLLAKDKEIDEDRPDLVLRCVECYQERRVIDMRKHIAIDATISPVNETSEQSKLFQSTNQGRNKDDPLLAFDEQTREGLQELLNTENSNKQTRKELEQYIKNHAAVIKKIDKNFKNDYGSLIEAGNQLINVENIRL